MDVPKKVTSPSVEDLFGKMSYGPAPESDGVAQAWLDDHNRNFGHFIGNEWVNPEGRKTYETVSPATGEVLSKTVQGNAEDIDLAVNAAKKAYPEWSQLSGG